ncbi:MAG: alanine racemase [Sphingorhabdus sp.]
MQISSPLRLRLDGTALVSNWKALSRLCGDARTGAALKADGYGIGAREVATRLSAAGCRDFFVAHWAEAKDIIDIVPAGQIAVLNGVSREDAALAIQLGAIPVLNTPLQVGYWKAAGGGRCHVMLDSGINRLGIGPEQLSAGLLDGLDIDILASHLASADEHTPQNDKQLGCFLAMAHGIKAARRSFANSAGIMLGSDYHFDLTRPGIALYGGIARPEMASFIRPVVQIEARVLQVRELNAGDPVGYNATYHCAGKTRVLTAAIGYADGYLRGFSGKGMATFKGVDMPLIGRVSMDLITIDAADNETVCEGDWIAIDYDLAHASSISGLSQYELLTGLGRRFDRLWA